MIRLAAALMMCCFSFIAMAQQATDLYRVEAQVANQSEFERVNAIKTSLGGVITRVLGNADGLQNPIVQQAVREAPNYLAKFSYASSTVLVLNFSPQSIQTLLQNAQLIAVPSNAPQNVVVHVVNVQDFTVFKQIQAYFKTLALVRRVELIGVNKEDVQINLTIVGDLDSLKSALDAGGKLQTVAADMPSVLNLRWQN